jgi:hypothetical protein
MYVKPENSLKEIRAALGIKSGGWGGVESTRFSHDCEANMPDSIGESSPIILINSYLF